MWQKYLSNKVCTSDLSNKKIYIRPEPRTAQYYKGGENFLDEVICKLKEQFSITMLTRDKDQYKHYKTPMFNGIDVPEKPLSFEEIAANV